MHHHTDPVAAPAAPTVTTSTTPDVERGAGLSRDQRAQALALAKTLWRDRVDPAAISDELADALYELATVIKTYGIRLGTIPAPRPADVRAVARVIDDVQSRNAADATARSSTDDSAPPANRQRRLWWRWPR